MQTRDEEPQKPNPLFSEIEKGATEAPTIQGRARQRREENGRSNSAPAKSSALERAAVAPNASPLKAASDPSTSQASEPLSRFPHLYAVFGPT
jgi:hypothetical protein